MAADWSDPIYDLCRGFSNMVSRRKMTSTERAIACTIFFDGAYLCARANYLFFEDELRKFKTTVTAEKAVELGSCR